MAALALGTVQFGLNYGTHNTSGQVPVDEVCSILEHAFAKGIDVLDTSAAYGDSEKALGTSLLVRQGAFKIVSKYPRSRDSVEDVLSVTLAKLGLSSIYGYMIHHFDFYKAYPEVWQKMKLLKEEGVVAKIGFSLYNPEELEFLLERDLTLDIVQFPYNLLDRRFSPYLSVLKGMGTEIHTRSVFLQGLFFCEPDSLRDRLQPLRPYLERINKFCVDYGVEKKTLALRAVLDNPYIDRVLIGVDSVAQLDQDIEASVGDRFDMGQLLQELDVKEKILLNPSNW